MKGKSGGADGKRNGLHGCSFLSFGVAFGFGEPD
jgi:hypothetical protein